MWGKVLVGLCLVCTLSCTTLQSPPPTTYLIPQRNPWDCGLAVVAMLAGRTYEDVESVAVDKGIYVDISMGMYDANMVDLAKEYGVILTPRSFIDYDKDEGILHIVWVMTGVHHFIYLKGGYLYDPLERLPTYHKYGRMGWNLVKFFKRNP